MDRLSQGTVSTTSEVTEGDQNLPTQGADGSADQGRARTHTLILLAAPPVRYTSPAPGLTLQPNEECNDIVHFLHICRSHRGLVPKALAELFLAVVGLPLVELKGAVDGLSLVS